MPAKDEKEKKSKKQRTCLACGRPLTGRKRKYCGSWDCGGWEVAHPLIHIECEKCGKPFETREVYGQTMCWDCYYVIECEQCGKPFKTREVNGRKICEDCYYVIAPKKTCIECGTEYVYNGPYLWCDVSISKRGKSCYEKYFEKNPHPDYFEREWPLSKNSKCLNCGEDLTRIPIWTGYCSATCDGIHSVRLESRKKKQEELVLKQKGELAALVFNYAWEYQWMRVRPPLSEWKKPSQEYLEERNREIRKERKRMIIRKQRGLPEDAPVPDSDIPETTELPIKLWLEENMINYETQYYVEISDTFTLVDFFIPLPDIKGYVCTAMVIIGMVQNFLKWLRKTRYRTKS